MKTPPFLAIFVSATVVLLAGSARAAVTAGAPFGRTRPQTEKFAQTRSAGQGRHLRPLEHLRRIIITGGSGDQVVIDAIKKAERRELKAVTIEVTSIGNRVEVRTRYPENSHNLGSVSVATRGRAAGRGGYRQVDFGRREHHGVDGELQSHTISGNVTVTAAADVPIAEIDLGGRPRQTSKSSEHGVSSIIVEM